MGTPVALRAFYAAKPLIPRAVQVRARRVRARAIWRRLGEDPRPPVAERALLFPWPGEYTASALVTHDVETAAGQHNIPALLEVEEALGIKSCWNFVVSRYSVDRALIKRLLAAGHEVGVHGVYHDGKLFDSAEQFCERLQIMRAAAADWGADGFRSPSLLYERSLLGEIDFSWDSSMPAWDPFQPKPGDCMTYVPFKLEHACIELPVTLWQDFTLFEELEMDHIGVWRAQSDFIARIGGLINVIVHPDYMRSEARLTLYRELLEHLSTIEGVWIALPREVSAWARQHL